ncbi:hypothetical protein C8A05DRAFT_20613, partial [Staphylotrichum tortipilum]
MAPESRLCSTCRSITLQALYRGTDYYHLGAECDLCDLIRPALMAQPDLAEGDELPQVTLRVDDTQQDSRLTAKGVLREAAHDMKQELFARIPGVRNITPKVKEYPFSRLTASTPWSMITMLKVTPLDGTL